MDQFIPGLTAAVQQTLQTELPAGFAGIVVGDDDFLIFAARRLGHTVGAHNAENVELLIQLTNVRAVVVGHHDIPLAVQKRIVEPLVIFLGKGYLIAFGLKVRRVTVDPRIAPVILADDILKVLVLHYDIRQSAGALPYQVEEAADVAGLASKGLAATAEAVPNQLEEICGTADISAGSTLQQKSADSFGLGRFEQDLSQLHFLLQVVIGDLTLGEKLVQDIEIIPRIQGQEAQFRQQRQGPVFHAAEQVGQIAVEVVIDFHAAWLDGMAHGHRAAAAEDIDETAVVIRSHLVDDPQQLALAAHPRDKAVQGTSPPSSGRES